jgi:hypothetical protein
MALQSVTSDVLSRGINRAVQAAYGTHYYNAENHARENVLRLQGHIRALIDTKEDDPLLYAYLIKDRIAYMAQAVIDIERWSYAVIDATPDQLSETGVQPCH